MHIYIFPYFEPSQMNKKSFHLIIRFNPKSYCSPNQTHIQIFYTPTLQVWLNNLHNIIGLGTRAQFNSIQTLRSMEWSMKFLIYFYFKLQLCPALMGIKVEEGILRPFFYTQKYIKAKYTAIGHTTNSIMYSSTPRIMPCNVAQLPEL